jgi:NAD(P)H-nitrite reductase large subunit
MKFVIIGNSTAAVGAVEGLRKTSSAGEITVISSENCHTYSRPLISYYLQGKTDEERMKFRPDDFYAAAGCKTIFGKTVLSIDKHKKSVMLDDGQTVDYDKLLIATGSLPFVPPFEGLDTVAKRFTFQSLSDAKCLEAAIQQDARVLIVGAGLIGLKCAEGILTRVGKITVVDNSSQILSSTMDSETAQTVQKHLEQQGLRFKLGLSVRSFEGNAAVLDNGEKIDFDLLVLAVGNRPNTSLLEDIGGEVNRGIVTDTRMQTSIPDIFAAGDCTISYDISCCQSRVLALLPNAYGQGECAGINMAGGEARYDRAIAMNAVGFFGLHIITAGSYTGDVYEKSDDKSCKKLFYKDGYLKGYILVGDVDKAGIYTSLIRNQTPITDIDFDLICEKPSLLAFSKKYRAETLGDVI